MGIKGDGVTVKIYDGEEDQTISFEHNQGMIYVDIHIDNGWGCFHISVEDMNTLANELKKLGED